MEYRDYYATLGVGKKASQDEIQKAYRKLARKLHPDVNKSPDAEGRFKEINEAYEVLKNADKRAKYDRFGSAWKTTQSGGAPPPGFEDVFAAFQGGGQRGAGRGFGGGSGFSSFFETLFGGGGGAVQWEWPAGGATPGGDQEAKLALHLEEAASGGDRELTIGSSAGGRQRVKVRLPPGVRPGQRIRLAGKAEGGGDLYLEIELLPDPRFRLEGEQLVTSLAVSPWEAALGSEVDVPTLDGPIRIKVPPGSSSGRRIRLRGRGYPNRRGTAGDLIAELKIVVPEKLSDDEKDLFQRLADASAFAPRS